MKGLLIKDYYLLFQRKQTLFLFFAICLLMGFTTDGTFIVGYMAFLSVILALSTISYDDADNGMMFLMTLPVSRKTYALSKYVIGGLFACAAWCLSLLIVFVLNTIKGLPLDAAETIITSLPILPTALLVLDLMIPLQLKFGAEKSRIVMLLGFGGIAACGALLSRNAAFSAAIAGLTEALDSIAVFWYLLASALAAAVLTVFSISVSVRVMMKKVF